ncbi:23S rRNA (adenine(2503)-C(2))-methyltransferase RlmN [Roseibacillus ishigakijimensis]|uniref:23S rRNA (adenine(2503)-C(2))-methyltransferase RlmN n=1 Tax=Roseibacillus ishigakijimensis TaxID=454146 RepID=UPI0027DCAC22|nr:23S rRNA (adenine(2503)-C(2))-methyltransferase RlmN [Roseibacillus ishigakijimensis]
MVAKPDLRSLTADEFAESFQDLGQPAYRRDQILDWLWKKRVRSIDEMSNLPAELRQTLKERYELTVPEVARAQGSKDTTRKLLLKLKDGRYVECVLIPASPALYGEQSDRLTLCVSSQVGCAFGCKFCASGLMGFTRNLTAGEITSQILLAEELAGTRVNNLVFMGMGEPLANLPNLLKAIELITSPQGLHIGARHLTISTSGVVPQIKKLADNPRQIRLAISLHGATDEVRSQIMPVNERWGVEALFEALRYWNSQKKQHLTLEYILIAGVNDDLEQARILAKRARGIRAKVNLIPYNTVEGLPWVRPSEDHCRAFRDILKNSGVQATLRLEKGHDIDAACGQLRLREENAKMGSTIEKG